MDASDHLHIPAALASWKASPLPPYTHCVSLQCGRFGEKRNKLPFPEKKQYKLTKVAEIVDRCRVQIRFKPRLDTEQRAEFGPLCLN